MLRVLPFEVATGTTRYRVPQIGFQCPHTTSCSERTHTHLTDALYTSSYIINPVHVALLYLNSRHRVGVR
jgi:hypothetical protein